MTTPLLKRLVNALHCENYTLTLNILKYKKKNQIINKSLINLNECTRTLPIYFHTIIAHVSYSYIIMFVVLYMIKINK